MITDINKGKEGASIFGKDGYRLGPSSVYYGKITPLALAGTVAAAGSATLTGTGTAFTTALKIGQWVKIGTLAPRQVLHITSDTSLLLDAVVTASGDTISLIRAIYLGDYDALGVKIGLEKQELKGALKGATRADKAINGYKCDIELGLVNSSLARLEAVMQGFILNRDSTTGAIKGAGFSVPIGQSDSDIWDELHVYRMVSIGVESTDPLDHLVIPLAAPMTDADTKYDASTQLTFKTAFTGYIDENTTLGGVPLVAYLGDIT